MTDWNWQKYTVFSRIGRLCNYNDLYYRLYTNATKDFSKNLFKLMNNVVFGKSMGNVRNHTDVKLFTRWNHAERDWSLDQFCRILYGQFDLRAYAITHMMLWSETYVSSSRVITRETMSTVFRKRKSVPGWTKEKKNDAVITKFVGLWVKMYPIYVYPMQKYVKK